MDFYLTLPSNSSMDYYPQNTVANYVTHLSRTIQLDGTWEASVVEVFFPCSFPTIDDSSYIYLHAYKESEYAAMKIINDPLKEEDKLPTIYVPSIIVCKLKHGNYNNVREVVEMINSCHSLQNFVRFRSDKNTQKITIECKEHVSQVEMTHRLALQLGFDPFENDIKKNNTSIRPANLNLGLPQEMYIYTDLVEPQFIGNSMAPLMRIVNIDGTDYQHGANRHVQFTTPHYVPVMKSSFESVEIDLRTSTGDKLPFQFGSSCVKLHFRKK